MSIELLREAAALMRKRADLPWVTGEWEAAGAGVRRVSHSPRVGHPWHARADAVLYDEAEAEALNHRIAEHIASWDPTVALAVADWLDDVAADVSADWPGGKPALHGQRQRRHAYDVARAYLGGVA